jgi:hypothetical protein
MLRFGRLLTALVFLFSAGTVPAGERMPPQNCTYETQTWSVTRKQSVDAKAVSHPYSTTAPDEIDGNTGCTVCREDQELISIPPLSPFSVCYKIAPRVRASLERLILDGAPVFAVIGYHVIKSRGPVDSAGNRTGFSNHSFGTAIDINPELNGLYDHCLQFGSDCRLIRGGEWRPGVLGTLERDSDIVRAFKSIGLRWGGEIPGRQKDFMHFSPTGY